MFASVASQFMSVIDEANGERRWTVLGYVKPALLWLAVHFDIIQIHTYITVQYLTSDM